MRLIRISSMKIEEVKGREAPPYAILSHTWGDNEISFTEFDDKARSSKHADDFKKIRGCCMQAACDGLDAVWIDTCCIDRRSSAELSEAINSMFKWYQNAAICYAYLDDVKTDTNDEDGAYPASFPYSRWFTRGWTLQELLAPSALVFYSTDWVSIGNRDDLVDVVAQTTQIHKEFFISRSLEEFSISQRMSWASRRQTTRIEDEAYCLLGLFGVSMPLIYGEGSLAFLRLQHEIMKVSDDQTIFAWEVGDLDFSSSLSNEWKSTLLAPSPKSFASSGNIRTSRTEEIYGPYAATNKGLQISLPLLDVRDASITLVHSQEIRGIRTPDIAITIPDALKVAILNCQSTTSHDTRVGLLLEQQQEPGTYARIVFRHTIFIAFEEARAKAPRTDLLIQIQNKTAQVLNNPITEVGRLIIIQPLHNLASKFKLTNAKSQKPWRRWPTGSLSSVFPEFSLSPGTQKPQKPQKPYILEYKDFNGNVFILLLRFFEKKNPFRIAIAPVIIANSAMGKDEAETDGQFREAFDEHGQQDHPHHNQSSLNGLLRIIPKVTEARHASIVTLEVRRVTEATRGGEGFLSVPSTRSNMSQIPPNTEDVSIYVTPPAEDLETSV
ncbi:heterokaryon incompatibility protein-domain-containing protein [Nemania sp. FL0916]|nr:heterokaryon incompatibility protein-domain-containing protein [Nemania sp. FL0916]